MAVPTLGFIKTNFDGLLSHPLEVESFLIRDWTGESIKVGVA